MTTLREAKLKSDSASFGRRDDWEIEGMTDTGEPILRAKRKKRFSTLLTEDDYETDFPHGSVSRAFDPSLKKRSRSDI